MSTISHSEVQTYQTCKQEHFYAFGFLREKNTGLEPKLPPVPLYRGIIGHRALESSFQAIKDGGSIEDAASIGISTANAYGLEPNANFEVLLPLVNRILPEFYEVQFPKIINENRVVAVEQTYIMQIGDMTYPFKPDAILLNKAKQDLVVWDHKFLYNFYSQAEIDLASQLPKYIAALRATNKPVQYAMYNMIRHREVSDWNKKFKLAPVDPTNARVQLSFATQIESMMEIRELKEGSHEEWRKKAHVSRVLNPLICNFCPFKKLCAFEVNGTDIEYTVKLEYQENSYGYEDFLDAS